MSSLQVSIESEAPMGGDGRSLLYQVQTLVWIAGPSFNMTDTGRQWKGAPYCIIFSLSLLSLSLSLIVILSVLYQSTVRGSRLLVVLCLVIVPFGRFLVGVFLVQTRWSDCLLPNALSNQTVPTYCTDPIIDRVKTHLYYTLLQSGIQLQTQIASILSQIRKPL